jgi:S1-C subfamily serine protease
MILAGPAAAQDEIADAMARTLRKVRDSVGRSVVAIEVARSEDPEGETGSGPAGPHQDYYNRPAGPVTGTILTADGFILTSAFNVSGEIRRITVILSDGRRLEAKRLGSNRPLDLALLKIEAKDLPVLPRAKVGEARVGDFVAVVGRAPDASSPTINQGILSALGRQKATAVQTDAELNYGNVGGPLVNLAGELIGVTAHIVPRADWGQSSGVGFAIKMEEIDKALESLKKSEDVAKAKEPWIGIIAAEPREKFEGVKVDQILPNSPAEEAGLDSGDLIVAAAGRPVKSVDDLKAILAARKIGDEIDLTIRRAKGAATETKKLKIKLADNPN